MEANLGLLFPTSGRYYSLVEWLVEVSGPKSEALEAAREAQHYDGENVDDVIENGQILQQQKRADEFDFESAWENRDKQQWSSDEVREVTAEQKSSTIRSGHQMITTHLKSSSFFRAVWILFQFRTRRNYSSPRFLLPRLVS